MYVEQDSRIIVYNTEKWKHGEALLNKTGTYTVIMEAIGRNYGKVERKKKLKKETELVQREAKDTIA